MRNEKSGGHSERSIGIGTIEVAVWDAIAKIEGKPLHRVLAERYNGGKMVDKCSSTSAAAGTRRARPPGNCRTRCGVIWIPATPW